MKVLSLCSLVVLMMNFAHAQEQSLPGDAEAKARIAAVERMSKSELNDEIERVEAMFYERLNAHIDDKKQRVHCAYVTPTGSHIRRWSCEPQFVKEAASNAAREIFEGSLSTAAIGGSLVSSISYSNRRAMTSAMNSALSEDEDLKSMYAYLEYLHAQ